MTELVTRTRTRTRAKGIGWRMAANLAAAYRRVFRRPARSMPWSWTSTMTLAAGAFILVTALMLLRDRMVMDFVLSTQTPFIIWLGNLSAIGQSHWYFVPAGLVFLGAGLVDWSAQSRRVRARVGRIASHAGFAFMAIAVSGLLVNALKIGIGRIRPNVEGGGSVLDLTPIAVGYDFASFPSGHATTHGAVAAVLALWMPRYRVPILLLGFLAGLTRVAARAHYPSDIVAGYALGVLYTLYLARWLAVRGSTFRVPWDTVFPRPR